MTEHQQKLNNYNVFLRKISETEKQNNKIDVNKKEEHDQIIMAKKMNLELENNFEKIANTFQNLKNNPFKNSKVRELWEKVGIKL